jgi:hypothetical protein
MTANDYRLLWKDAVLAALSIILAVLCGMLDGARAPMIFFGGIALALVVRIAWRGFGENGNRGL